ncbi:MAG: RNA polymerase sigma factor [Myxococcales bacterium]|nr:RNA polymerase sigma factor [Myxococcales bacterium]
MVPSSDVVSRGSPGHRQALLARLYGAHLRDVWRWLGLFGVRPSDLEDAAHDVFLAAFRALDAFEARASHRTWLFGITRHVAIDHRRRVSARRESGDALPEREDPQPGPDDALRVHEARRLLDAMLGALADEQRDTFLLYELGGYSGADIAELMEVPLQTVFSRLRRAREHVEAQSLTRHEP